MSDLSYAVGYLRVQRRYHEERMVLRLHFGGGDMEGDDAKYHQARMQDLEAAIALLERGER